MHTPVLLQETVMALEVEPGKTFIDATAGEGGHIYEILKKGGTVLAIDWDQTQLNNLKKRFAGDNRVAFAQGNFATIEELAKHNGFAQVDGVLFDLGLSMSQLKEGKRGFSYKNQEEPLDMRIDVNEGLTAENIINTYSEKQLYDIFAKNAEEINALALSEAFVRARTVKRLKNVGDVVSIIDRVTPYHRQKTHARIFQALRMEVNDELSNLKLGLAGALRVIRKGGKIAVISFHSREDRVIKLFMREHGLKQIHKKVIRGHEELAFERSAKLRVFTSI